MRGIKESSLIKITLVLAISLLYILFGSGCKKKQIEISPEIASSAENLYRQGERYIKKDPERARLYFRQIIESFPQDIYAQQARLAIADSYFRKGDEANMILAASEYRNFIKEHPHSPSVPYAQYQIAMTFYRKILRPGRDPEKTHLALEEFKKVLTNYPTSEEASDAQEKILECEERLAEHTFQIGLLYYKMRSYRASVKRLAEILLNFPNFSRMDKVYFYLGDSFFKGRNYANATSHFTKLVSDYPQSKFAKKAKKKLDQLEKLRKEAEKKAPPKKKAPIKKYVNQSSGRLK
ncbi:MAG: outer membrane protein assembly factor BamD [Candidatus Aminicenantes bacterium]|jgi:outer membrane protein assembly factor BamD